ncbi:hypothetical protein GQ600_20834 [Phytophthora cactorum]|nr:hypothetical protein GQ600_20834 [Phytophthora cactorum]
MATCSRMDRTVLSVANLVPLTLL